MLRLRMLAQHQSRAPALFHALVMSALALSPGVVSGQTPSAGVFVPVTDAMLQHPADGDWLSWRRTLNSWGYSPLAQVTRDNVDDLQMPWPPGDRRAHRSRMAASCTCRRRATSSRPSTP